MFQKISSNKYLLITLSILMLCSYSFIVFAAPPSSGGYAPAATLEPECDPGERAGVGSGVYDCYVTTSSGRGSGWSLTGDTGTDDTVNFLGTTDAQDLVIKVDGLERARFGQSANIELSNYNDGSLMGNDTNGNSKVTASGNGAVAWGGSTGSYAYPWASGELSTAWGVGTIASSYYATAFGDRTQATEENATAFGTSTVASGVDSTAWGQSTTASGSSATAFGLDTTASGYGATAFGRAMTAPSPVEVALGHFGTDYTPASLLAGEFMSPYDRLFVIGNGDNSSLNTTAMGVWPDQNDAFTILKNGQVGIGINNFENTSNQLNGGTPLFQVGGLMAASGSYTGLVTDANKAAHFFNTNIIPDASVNRSEYYGINSVVTYDPNSSGLDLSYSGASGVDEANSNITAGFFRANLAGTGDVRRANGSSSMVTINGTGSYNYVAGASSIVILNSGSTLADATGTAAQVLPLAGTISHAKGLSASVNGDVLNTGTDRITLGNGVNVSVRNTTTAIGGQFEVRQIGSTAKGISMETNTTSGTSAIESGGSAYGMYMGSASLVPGITGVNTYGIYMSTNALSGSSNEYAMYLDDAEAQNYFKTGLRIGSDSDDNKISSATSGSGSTQLYIGTNTIDTTAPSDQRTKQNIQDTAYGIETLNDIRVVDFIYKQSIIDDNQMQHTGVLAQQVRSLYPEAVSTRSDGFMMVDYKTFIPLIIKSVQDLNIKIQDVEAIASTVTPAMFAEIRTWLGDMTNGIETIYAKVFKGDEIDVKTMCVSDDTGSKTCITKNQLDALLEGIGSEIDNNSNDEPVDQQVNNESEDQGTDEPQDNQNMENPVLEAPEENSQENPEPEITDESTTTEPQTEPVQEDSSTENTASDTQSAEASI